MGRAPKDYWYKGEYYRNPWWKDNLAENSAPYEDDKPTHIKITIDPLKPRTCPKCTALLFRDGSDIACWYCGWRDCFHFDTVVLAKIAKFWERVKVFGNQDVLKSREENRVAEVARQYRLAHKDKAAVYNKLYRETHAEQIKETERKRKLAHPEKVKQYADTYYRENRDVIKRRQRIYVENHREQVNERQRIYRAKQRGVSYVLE